MCMRKILYVILSMCLMAVSVADLSAQEDRREVRKGNRRFKDGAFGEAGIEYMRALQKDSMSVAANYNLANALYRQEDYEKAKEALGRIKDVAPMTPDAASYFYNLGSVAIAQQDWQTAVQAFAQSLLVNPGDLDAKENYIYAKKKLQDQQQDQQDPVAFFSKIFQFFQICFLIEGDIERNIGNIISFHKGNGNIAG